MIPDLFQEDFPPLSFHGTPDRCKKCGSAIWKVICRTGFNTLLDTQPVTPAQDLEFYLSGRRTYRLWKTGDTWEVDFRTPMLILSNDGDDIALPEHRCDQTSQIWPTYFAKPHNPSAEPNKTEEFPF